MHKRIILNDLALDLNISPSDIIHMFQANNDYSKTPLSSLSVEEANWLLEKITQDNMVENFNDFFATHSSARPKPEQPSVFLKKGQIVKGVVKSVDNSGVSVDLGNHISDFATVYNLTIDVDTPLNYLFSIGDKIQFRVLNTDEFTWIVNLRSIELDIQIEEERKRAKEQKEQERISVIVDEVLSQVQDNLSAMKPGLISEIAVSVYSKIETKMMDENIALKERVCELEKRLLQLERIIDKQRIEE